MNITLASGLSLKQRGCALYLKDEYHENESNDNLEKIDNQRNEEVGKGKFSSCDSGNPENVSLR